jgi:hypothetical protein
MIPTGVVLLATTPVRRAMEVLQMMTQSEIEQERYQARLRFQRDQHSNLMAAREEGEILGRISVCQRLLKLPLTPREDLLAVPWEELQAKLKAMEQQLGIAGS